MKTPYDAAHRAAERRLEDVRTRIGRAIETLTQLEDAHHRATRAMERECVLAAGGWWMASEHYFARARTDRAQLAAERAAIHARLDELRGEAASCYGERSAIDGAIARFREEADRAEAAAEQATLDDLSAARLCLDRRRASRIGASPP